MIILVLASGKSGYNGGGGGARYHPSRHFSITVTLVIDARFAAIGFFSDGILRALAGIGKIPIMLIPTAEEAINADT